MAFRCTEMMLYECLDSTLLALAVPGGVAGGFHGLAVQRPEVERDFFHVGPPRDEVIWPLSDIEMMHPYAVWGINSVDVNFDVMETSRQ